VTVTHPDIYRYFMTIPESVQLIMQAGAMGKGGEIFILDMGEPVKIVDLARDMIRLSGLDPDKDIRIMFTGLRPGEKLYEELLTAGEEIKATLHDKIKIAGIEQQYWKSPLEDIEELLGAISEGFSGTIIEKIKEIVPDFQPENGGPNGSGDTLKNHSYEIFGKIGRPRSSTRLMRKHTTLRIEDSLQLAAGSFNLGDRTASGSERLK